MVYICNMYIRIRSRFEFQVGLLNNFDNGSKMYLNFSNQNYRQSQQKLDTLPTFRLSSSLFDLKKIGIYSTKLIFWTENDFQKDSIYFNIDKWPCKYKVSNPYFNEFVQNSLHCNMSMIILDLQGYRDC